MENSKKIKISIIGSRGYPFVYSGYETFVKELSERLVLKNIEVKVYCHSSLFSQKKKLINGINLIYTPSIKNKFFSQLYNSFFSFLHACFSNTDIILVVNVANGPFGLITKLFKKKTVINVDGLEWERPKWKGIGSIYYKIAANIATKMYDVIVTDSYEMSKIYFEKFNTSSKVISYGHNKKFKTKTNILDKYQLKKDNYFLVIGRMVPDNNADFIIKQFLSSSSNKKLVIIGDVPYKDNFSLNIKSKKNDRIVLTGYINNDNQLADFYKNCYGYVHGHEFGGTNPTLINALFYNSIIISLDTVFTREMMSNLKNKYFFSKKDNSLKKFFENNSLIRESNGKVKPEYKWNFVTEKYLDIFRSLVE